MKKIAIILLTVLLCAGLVGCDKSEETEIPSPPEELLTDDSNTATETEVYSYDSATEAESEPSTQTSTPDPSPSVTTGQRNALAKAKQYLDVIPLSHQGLVAQLEYEGYTNEEAVYGADNCGADWNEQAALKAEQYLEIMAFSRDGLIEQLVYEGFTHAQAVYGVEENGY